MVGIQQPIPFSWLTFYKESNDVGYFIAKYLFHKTVIFPWLQKPGKNNIFQTFFPETVMSSIVLAKK